MYCAVNSPVFIYFFSCASNFSKHKFLKLTIRFVSTFLRQFSVCTFCPSVSDYESSTKQYSEIYYCFSICNLGKFDLIWKSVASVYSNQYHLLDFLYINIPLCVIILILLVHFCYTSENTWDKCKGIACLYSPLPYHGHACWLWWDQGG